MKIKGVVRQMDELGRIVIPMEYRKIMGIEPREALEIFATDEGLFIRKYDAKGLEGELA